MYSGGTGIYGGISRKVGWLMSGLLMPDYGVQGVEGSNPFIPTSYEITPKGIHGNMSSLFSFLAMLILWKLTPPPSENIGGLCGGL